MDSRVLYNVRKTCRTCMKVLESRNDLVNIFNFDETLPLKKVKFSEMLKICAEQTVYEEDNLPKKICILCLSQLRAFYYFKLQAKLSYETLIKQQECVAEIPVNSIKKELASTNKCQKQFQLQHHQQHIELEPHDIEFDPSGLDDDFGMLVEIDPPQIQASEAEFLHESGDDEPNYDADLSDYGCIEAEPAPAHTAASDTAEPSPSLTPRRSNSGTSGAATTGSVTDEDSTKMLVANENLAPKQKKETQFKTPQTSSYKNSAGSKCAYCDMIIMHNSGMPSHVRFKHPDKFDEFKKNWKKPEIGANVIIEPLKSIPECTKCSQKFWCKNALYKHHAECDQRCIDCNLKIPRLDFYWKHLEKEHGVKPDGVLECPFCMNQFHSSRILQEHIQRMHPDGKDFEDSVADSSEAGETDAATVIENNVECVQCNVRFASARSLAVHNNHRHKVGNVDAPKSSKVTRYTKEEFTEKFYVRKSNDTFRCNSCARNISKQNLIGHLKTKHAAIKCHGCELCPERFVRSDYRQKHMTSHHFNDFRCSICNVQFDRTFKYDAHMVQHGVAIKNSKSPDEIDIYDLPVTSLLFIEDMATYDYSEDSTIQDILNNTSKAIQIPEISLTKDEFIEKYFVTHNEKSAECTVCQVRLQKQSIVSHMLWRHAVKRPMKCSFCNERVIKNAGRLAHMARCHYNEYRCADCDIQYTKHHQFAAHMEEFHNITVESKPSSGEEEDLLLNDLRFITNKNEDEIIEEPEIVPLESEPAIDTSENASASTAISCVCPFCDKTFTNAKNLLIHKSHKHVKEIQEIRKKQLEMPCDPVSFEAFNHEWIQNVSEIELKCLACDQLVKKKNIGLHMKSKHATSGAWLCALCPEAFFRPEQRMQHMTQAHHGVFFCDTCNVQFIRNSRYSKHMLDIHDIEIEATDEYEVDVPLTELKFIPTIKKFNIDDDQNSMSSSMVAENGDQLDQLASDKKNDNENELSRDEFINKYIKNIAKDTRRCTICERSFNRSALYQHMFRFHATIYPFKCPFCDLRLERNQYRVRHMQVFHPDEYKCIECGLQFVKHSQFKDHMLVEHNKHISAIPSPGEETDLTSYEIQYRVQRQSDCEDDESIWQNEENLFATEENLNATISIGLRRSTIRQSKPEKSIEFLKPAAKTEPIDKHTISHSIFGSNETESSEEQANSEGLTYIEFKSKYMVDVDPTNHHCLACDRLIPKTSACAHLRLWHAIKMSFNCELCEEGFQRTDYRMRHMKWNHPSDLKCSICQVQYHRAILYKQHMFENHDKVVNIVSLKTKDEVDVPLEHLRFVEHVPASIRNQGSGDLITKNGEVIRRRRSSISEVQPPINRAAGGMTGSEFSRKYISVKRNLLVCTICNTNMTKFSVKKHLKRFHATTKAYYCEICCEGFHRPDVRMNHMRMVHPSSLNCFDCKTQFYCSKDYSDHMTVVHNTSVKYNHAKKKELVDVPIDRLRFVPEIIRDNISSQVKEKGHALGSNKHKTFDHISDDAALTREQFSNKFFRKATGSHSEPHTKCLACHKVFGTKNRKTHLLHNHATTRSHKCELCTSEFCALSRRIKHMQKEHPSDYFCHICKGQYDRAKFFIDHMKKCHQITVDLPTYADEVIDRPFQEMRFIKNVSLQKQLIKTNRGPAQLSLETLTDNSMTDWDTSSSAMMSHEAFRCAECDIEFDSARSLRNHARSFHVHGVSFIGENSEIKDEIVDEKLHECSICSKRFSAAFSLNAHMKFKHNSEGQQAESTVNLNRKRKVSEKPKHDFECDICDFVTYRRDYVEHHVRAQHPNEFMCRECLRTLSTFSFYLYHMDQRHKKIKVDLQDSHKCSKCDRYFKFEENLHQHMESKHSDRKTLPENYCNICCVSYKEHSSLESHRITHMHKGLQLFLEKRSETVNVHQTEVQADVNDGDDSLKIKEDTFTATTEAEDVTQTSTDEPPEKILRLQPPEKHRATAGSSEEDKLDYLNFLIYQDGIFVCGICGRKKTFRKRMLHHLKQHSEIPTYDCPSCRERFVFKRKYESHLKTHQSQPAVPTLRPEEVNAEEHPRFQDVPSPEIKCHICKINLKMNFMLNRHNATWHSDDNPLKDLNMNEQKAKKEVTEQEPEVGIIKLLRCKHCFEAFIQPDDLVSHLKTKHNSNSIDQPPASCKVEEEESYDKSQNVADGAQQIFSCDKCLKCVFHERKFLDNHQKFFCANRQVKIDTTDNDNEVQQLPVNEQ